MLLMLHLIRLLCRVGRIVGETVAVRECQCLQS